MYPSTTLPLTTRDGWLGDEAGLPHPAAEASQPHDSNADTQMVIITGMTSFFPSGIVTLSRDSAHR